MSDQRKIDAQATAVQTTSDTQRRIDQQDTDTHQHGVNSYEHEGRNRTVVWCACNEDAIVMDYDPEYHDVDLSIWNRARARGRNNSLPWSVRFRIIGRVLLNHLDAGDVVFDARSEDFRRFASTLTEIHQRATKQS